MYYRGVLNEKRFYISGWIYFNSSETGNWMMISKSTGGVAGSYYIYGGNLNGYFVMYGPNAERYDILFEKFSPEKWYHLTAHLMLQQRK